MPFDPQQVENAGAPKPPAAALGGTRIRYWHTYAFIFENPKWATNVFYGFLCVLSSQLIPVVGVLLFIGYIFDVAESLHRHPDRTYPDFTFNKFSNYLQRGVWPFLVSLVFSIPILAVLAMICVVAGFGVAAAASAVGREIVPWVIVGGRLGTSALAWWIHFADCSRRGTPSSPSP